MATEVPKFTKLEKETLYFNQEGEFQFLVPEYFFERGIAETIGDNISILGILNYRLVDKDGKPGEVKTFNFPTRFDTSPSIVTKEKRKRVTKHQAPMDYRVFHYKKGDKIVLSIRVPQVIVNAEDFYKIMLGGKLPTTIPVDEITDYIIDNIHLNGGDYGLSRQLFGLIPGELCRDPKDVKKLYRHGDMKDPTAYQYISIRQNPKYISPMTAITSENIDEAIITSLNNKNPKASPLEKILMGR